MKASLRIAYAVFGIAPFLTGGLPAHGQIVINELVKEERTAGSGGVTPDRREFIELYNAGSTAVDLSNWSIVRWDLGADGIGAPNIVLPAGASIAPDDYYVIGGVMAQVPTVDFTPGAGTDLFPDGAAYALELRNSSNAMQDAVAYEVHRTGIFPLTVDQAPQVGQGFFGQLLSMNHNVAGANSRVSWSRWLDGRDTNNNGRDFGILPITPGASNDQPQNTSHTIPDVDSLAIGTQLGAQYHASFVLPRVIDPTVATAVNPRALPERSPQGGNAIIAYDETGGGNTSYSKELVNSFDLYAYFDTAPIGVAPTTLDEEFEVTSYGIGTADAFYGMPDPSGGIFVDGTVTQNASSGIGWVFQQYEEESATVDQPAFTKLFLVDFGDSGNSRDPAEWEVKQEIDMSQMPSDWYRLGIDYDSQTGDVVATFGEQEFMFTTDTGLLGNFFVGYREAITGDPPDPFSASNPPIYDLFEEEAPALAGDYNDDGNVDAADYTVWRDQLGAATALPNETVTLGSVTPEDYDAWKANFGAMGGSGSALGAGAVPEPGALVLALGGALAVAARGGRRRTAV